MLRLLIRSDDGTERPVEVHEGLVRIGRSPDNDIVLGDANKGVSRAHAELRFESGRWVILDLNSQNGTWVNGQRVQRAEVPLDAEITVGLYRLVLQAGGMATSVDPRGPAPRPAPPATLVSPRAPAGPQAPIAPTVPVPVFASTPKADLPLRSAATATPKAPAKPAPAPPRRSSMPVVAVAAAVLIAIGVVAWFVVPSFGHRSEPAAAQAPGTAPASASDPATTPASTAASAAAAPAPPPAAPTPATPDASSTPDASAAPPKAAASSAAVRAAAANAARAIAPAVPVARKPGESLQAWRERSSALQARYAYSKVALDRGDYAAAAGGFAAILLEEPGFLDAPQLLVKARDGLRAAAHDAMEAGNRFDAAGDWISALRKYDQAREIDASTPGLDDASRRVREKMRVAGNDALKRARQYDALGRPADALKEYEKAAQWLPTEDPNRDLARTRADQLKAGIK